MAIQERELFDEKIRGIYAAISSNADIQNEHFKRLDEKLDRIEIQTTKTNGRVSLLEQKELQHIQTCPVAKEVVNIKNDLVEYQIAKKYPKILIIGGLIYGAALIVIFLVSIGIL